MEDQLLTRNKTKEQAQEEELLPGIPNDVTLEHITPRLPWKEFQTLSLVSRSWVHSIRTCRVHHGRVRSRSMETFHLVDPIRSRKITIEGNHSSSPPEENGDEQRENWTPPWPYPPHGIALYSTRDNSSCELPPIPSLPEGIPRRCQFVSVDGKIYVLGGENLPLGRTYGFPTSKGYVLDLAAGRRQWKECASMREPSVRFGCEVIHGKIYVFGGVSCTTPICGSEVYDPEENVWSEIRPMTAPRLDHRVDIVGEELLVHGGIFFDRDRFNRGLIEHGEYMQVADFAEVYTPAKDEWRVLKPFKLVSGKEALFTAQERLHSMILLGLYVNDAEARGNSSMQLHSVFSILSPGVGVESVKFVGARWPLRSRISFPVDQLLAVVAVHDELLAVVSYHDRERHDTRFSLVQSRGFSSKKEMVWQEPQFSFTFADGMFSRLYPIQL